VVRLPPPPVLDSARVLSYAHVENLAYRKCGSLWSGDKLVEAVPQLAICINLGKDIGAMLFHCDAEWQVLGVSGGPTVEETKLLAERNYPGVGGQWVDVNTSVDDALRYYDQHSDGLRCSFCGKRHFEVKGMVGGPDRAICRGCVEEFHEAFNESGESDAAL
jgi:hypothetical protein